MVTICAPWWPSQSGVCWLVSSAGKGGGFWWEQYIIYIIRVKIITNCHLVNISEPRSAARPRLAGGLARRGRGVAAHQLLYVGLTTRVLKIFDDGRKIF